MAAEEARTPRRAGRPGRGHLRAGAGEPANKYHHFESKEGLYKAALAEEWVTTAALGPVLRKAVGLEPRAGLELAFRGFARILDERPLVQRLAMQEALSGWRYTPRATMAQNPEGAEDTTGAASKSGAFRQDVPFELLYFAMLAGHSTGRARW